MYHTYHTHHTHHMHHMYHTYHTYHMYHEYHEYHTYYVPTCPLPYHGGQGHILYPRIICRFGFRLRIRFDVPQVWM